jgi:predicted phosphodiesterase
MLSIKCPECGSRNWNYAGYKRPRKGETVKAQQFYCKDCHSTFNDERVLDQFPEVNIELLRENIRLARKAQRFTDSNRIERNAFRDYARIDNATSEYNQELIKLLRKYNLAGFTIKHNSHMDTAAGIIHFTDAHFNELVNLAINRYDFTVASKRCKLLVEEAKQYFKIKGIRSILFAMTGDLINSDRRLDELLNEATNRSKATFIAVRLIELMLLDLNSSFNIKVANVTGNESRVQKDVAWSNILATDNYDFTVFNILEYLFRGSKGIKFLPSTDPLEQVVRVNGKNVLLIHGHQLKGNVSVAIARLRGKYAARGTIVDFVIFGHLHEALISDTFARGSSMVGANEYSDKGKDFISRASQNIHIIYSHDKIDSIKIDLQDVEGIEGYDIKKELEIYEAKPTGNKLKPVVHEVKV